MSEIELSAVLKLPVSERLRLVDAIWNSIAEHPETIALSDIEREVLDYRWAKYLQNPGAGLLWSEVKARIISH